MKTLKTLKGTNCLVLLMISIGISGCKQVVTAPEENTAFNITGIWQNQKDSIIDDIHYDYLPTCFNLNPNAPGDGYFIFAGCTINLTDFKITFTDLEDVSFTATSTYYDVQDIIFRGNVVDEGIHGQFNFKVNDQQYIYVLHLVKQSIKYLPKIDVERSTTRVKVKLTIK